MIAWCAAAAAYAVGDEAAAAALEEYGRAVGVAFQITDDVLDYSEHTGKAPGADLRERKVNLPLLLAMSRIPGLRERLSRRAPTPDELPGLMAEIENCGALDDALDVARRYVDRGIGALAVLPDSDARQALEVLGRFLVERRR